MTRNFGCGYDIKLKFSQNVSNRKILNVTKFCSPTGYEIKVIKKCLLGGGGGAESPPGWNNSLEHPFLFNVLTH